MSHTEERTTPIAGTVNANDTSNYLTVAVAVVVGMAGVMLRFLGTWPYIDAVSNILLIIGTVIALKAVFATLK